MDRNSLVGLLLIGLILVGYSYLTKPTEEEIAKAQITRDSIAQVEQEKIEEAERLSAKDVSKEIVEQQLISNLSDSAKEAQQKNLYGEFYKSANQEIKYYTIENEKVLIKISNKGGRPVTAILKDYQTYDSLPLQLFTEDSSRFNLNFFYQNRLLNTEDLFWKTTDESFEVSGEEIRTITFRLSVSNSKYIEYSYRLKGNEYMLDFDVNIVGMDDMLSANNMEVGFNWGMKSPSKENNKDNQYNKTTIFYKYIGESVDYIAERSEDIVELEAKTKWVGYKQQYFSAVAISDKGFDKINSQIESKDVSGKNYTKEMNSNLTLVFDNPSNSNYGMHFYFGPNHYKTLKSYDLELQDMIDLGWGIIGWVNELVIINMFNFFGGLGWSYGIIILLITVIIKLALSPVTYKTYVSSAKMRVIKPEVDELNEKNKNADPMKKQQAVMALYKKAGVNPMAGCVPQLIQLPILYAMFTFFPSSIELRQQGFLWATDLSTYDSIVDLPFTIPFYGDHISLFTLLMAASMFLYSKYNMQMATTSGPQVVNMKVITYMMPFMLLIWFNTYSAGLSYYYFTANVMSIIQQLVIKNYIIDEDAIHRRIQENKKKTGPVKKSKFQKKLEEMAKKRGYDPNKR